MKKIISENLDLYRSILEQVRIYEKLMERSAKAGDFDTLMVFQYNALGIIEGAVVTTSCMKVYDRWFFHRLRLEVEKIVGQAWKQKYGG